jgi:hypothetical protein
MRGNFIFAVLLLAVSVATAAGSPAKPVQAHRKASASAHQARQASSQTKSKTTTASRKAAKRTKLRPAPRATMRKAKYTPERTMVRTPAAANTVSDFEVGYKKGFEAGRAAALRQLDNNSADPNLSGRGSESLQTGAKPLTAREPLATEQPATDGAAHTPALSETPKTETPEAPPPAEMASLSMSGMGLPGSLRGSLASLERQNTRTEADGLERIEDEDDLTNRIAHKLLVPLPASAALTVNPGLPAHNRYCRPWTARFVADLARAHQAVFHRPIQVNSAVRTVEYQKRLMRINGNAAAAEGDVVSPHLTGATIDIGKSGLSRKELAWMRQQLLGLQQAGKIDVEEEFEQACFHITVYKSYAPAKAVHKAAEPAPNSTQRKTARPATQRHGSSLPADLATGLFPAQGR